LSALYWPASLKELGSVPRTDWISTTLLELGMQPGTPVGVFMPSGFTAYLRILHRAGRAASDDVSSPVRWYEVADLTGAVLHPLAQFNKIAAGLREVEEFAIRRPDEGELDGESCTALAENLQAHTSFPDQCFFAFWDGLGQVFESAPLTGSLGIGLRSYKIGWGPINSVCEFPFWPAFWWPMDRKWLVATDVDMNSTLVGCDRAAADRVLADGRLEAFEVSREARIDESGDTVNG
jgi:hypothetical protein